MLKRLALATIVPMALAAALTPSAAFAGSGSPAGNNGTVKIAEDGDVDTPSNDPHVGCTFTVEWYGYDKGSNIISNVSFEMQAPTAGVALSVAGDTTVFVGGDDNSGGGSAAGLDGREQYTLSFKGAPHPQQGYHVKMTINTPGSNGADKKSKVFWVTGCAETVTPAPRMSMTKTVTDSNDADNLASKDETLTYAFSVTNTGNVPLTNVKVTDAMIPALVNGAVCVASLPVGATTTCPSLPAATHVVTAAEVAAGKVTNNATGTGTPPSGANVTAAATARINTWTPPAPPADPGTPVVDAPSIALTKTVADSDDADNLASEDELLTYGFSVTNTGNVALTNVTITDAMIPALAHGATCVATLAAGATTTCPSLPAATHTVTAADVAHGSVDNTATAAGTAPAGSSVTAQDSATIGTLAAEEQPPVTTPEEPFSWDWTYEDPTCTALNVAYPSNIPDGQANDVNIRINTNQGQVTLNFHNNDDFWGGTTSFDYRSHPQWPAGVTSYSVVWTQVGGTNYHWQGNVKCLINDDGDATTDDTVLGVTSISGFRTGSTTVQRGDLVSADLVNVSQADDQDLVLQVLSAGSARAAATWHDVKTVATNGDAAKVTFGRQTRRGTFTYRLAVAGSETVTGATTKTFTVRVK